MTTNAPQDTRGTPALITAAITISICPQQMTSKKMWLSHNVTQPHFRKGKIMLKIIDKRLYDEDGTPLQLSIDTFSLMCIAEIAKTLPQIIAPYFDGYEKMWIDYNSDYGTLLITIYGYKNEAQTISVRYDIYTDCVNFMKWRVTKCDYSYFNFIQTRSEWIKCNTVTEMVHQMATAYQIGNTDTNTITRMSKEI